MRSIRFTKAEAEALLGLLAMRLTFPWSKPELRALASVQDKVVAAREDAGPSVNVGALERALLESSRGKAVALVPGPSYGRAAKQAAAAGATVEDMQVMGAWLARQGWMRDPTTLLGVLNKWAEWLPRARATATPPAAREGFDGPGETGPGAAGPSGGGGGRGTPPGFG